MPREQRRSIFRDYNIHVINDNPAKKTTTLNLAEPKCEECMDEIVDIFLPRDAHGNASFLPAAHHHLLTRIPRSLDNLTAMDPRDPMNQVSSIPLKPFLDYSRSASTSEETIFDLRTADAHEHLRHLQVMDIPHDNITLGQSWNFLDIPLSVDLDFNMSSVPLLFFHSHRLL